MNEADLRNLAEQGGLLPDGALICPGELRRLVCDADLVPAVLGSHSEVLDVGRAQRLVTPAIRRALSLRDRGCVFPGCDVEDWRCEAHHITPWWAGGHTNLNNLALLCPHHHAEIEPPRFHTGPPPDRWRITIGPNGLPELTPPQSLANVHPQSIAALGAAPPGNSRADEPPDHLRDAPSGGLLAERTPLPAPDGLLAERTPLPAPDALLDELETSLDHALALPVPAGGREATLPAELRNAPTGKSPPTTETQASTSDSMCTGKLRAADSWPDFDNPGPPPSWAVIV